MITEQKNALFDQIAEALSENANGGILTLLAPQGQ